jgi:hypothetical protein
MEGLNVGLTRRYGVAGVYGPLHRGSGFNPLSLSPDLWLRGGYGTLQLSGGSAATADGDPIGQWRDQGPNGNHLTQTGSKRGTLKLAQVDSQSVNRCDGSDDQYPLTTTLTLSGAFRIFIVQKTTGDLGFFGNSATTGPQLRIGRSGSNVLSFRTDGGAGEIVSGALSVARTSFSVVEWDRDGSNNVRFFENGVALSGSGTLAGTATFDQFSGLMTLSPINGDIAEVYVKLGGMSDANATLFRSYLHGQYPSVI